MALTEFLASRLGSGDHRRRGSARVRRSDLEKVEEFLAVKDQLIAEARTLPGLTASATADDSAAPGPTPFGFAIRSRPQQISGQDLDL